MTVDKLKTKKLKTLIIGAGVGGLTAAIALAQNGLEVEVFERAEKLGDVGAGLQLSPNAMAVLSSLGLTKQLQSVACEPEAGILRDYKTGKALLTTTMQDVYERRYGHDYLHIHRADLMDCLANAARDAGVKIHLSTEITSVAETETGVRLQGHDQDFFGNLLIGAGGVRFFLREKISGISEPHFTGQVAWRGIVPTVNLPPNTIPFAANNWLGPGRHFVSYYVRGGEQINFVAVEERPKWAEERWDIPADLSELKHAFTGWDPRVTALINACDEAYLWGLFDHAPLPQWTKGHMTLLGDAAHPMLPFMAQGAAMAIEDAWVLTHCVVHNPTDLTSALRDYEAFRKPRATQLQKISRKNAALYHQRSFHGRVYRKAKLQIATHIPAAAFSRLDKIYGVDVTQDFPI